MSLRICVDILVFIPFLKMISTERLSKIWVNKEALSKDSGHLCLTNIGTFLGSVHSD